MEIIWKIEPTLHWLALLDTNIVLSKADQLDDHIVDMDQTWDTENKTIVLRELPEVGNTW